MSEAQLETDGVELHRGFLPPVAIAELERMLGGHPRSAGVRLFANPELSKWIVDSPLLDLASAAGDAPMQPVRAILFDKTRDANWALGWHQDRTIAVRRRVEARDFEHWTTKAGAPHVEPPFSIIERMVTARVHLDPVGPSNSPLMVAPGSHRLGRILEAEIQPVVERCGTLACLAERGDVWLYRTAILHASERSVSGAGRRVLQVDFSSDELPGELDWLRVA